MFAIIDCMHWWWKNCHASWVGQHTNESSNKSIVLKAMVDQSVWIWHAYFGVSSSNNNLIVFNMSPLIKNIRNGRGVGIIFRVNRCV